MDLRNEYQKLEGMIDSVGDLLGAEHWEAAGLVFKRLVEASVSFKDKLPGKPKEEPLPVVAPPMPTKLEPVPVAPPEAVVEPKAAP